MLLSEALGCRDHGICVKQRRGTPPFHGHAPAT